MLLRDGLGFFLSLLHGRLASRGGGAHFDCHLGDAAGETRLGFAADGFDHGRAQVNANIGRLVAGKDSGLGPFDAALGHLGAVNEEGA